MEFSWSEKDIMEMPAHIIKKRMEQLKAHLKNKKSPVCPLTAK